MVGAVDEQACWTLPAVPGTVRQLRTRVTAFAQAAGMPSEPLDDVALAVSETVTNAVVHAYAAAPEPGQVRVRCHIAEALVVTLGPGGHGTTVTMTFAARTAPELAPSGLEALCRLALDTVADASCVDLVRGGVLRRGAAEVAGDAGLTAWLRNATPPAKPGTATWAALREGGAHLVVHDPTVSRSPAGIGEVLDLSWWVAVPLEGRDGAPEALWGLGGRAGGRAAPSSGRLDALASAARGDLSDEAQRAALLARLREPR